MNHLFHVLIFIWIFLRVNGDLFDRYSGSKIDDVTTEEPQSGNAIQNCTIEIKACTPHEGSRVDGTCNNYKYPSRGSARGPYLRLLKPNYGNNTQDIGRGKNGAPLPSARKVRTALQSTGRVEDKQAFNVAAVHFLEFIVRDVSALSGPMDFLKAKQQCCKPEGESDPRCMPIRVPADDPYLKVTDIRCLNFTRAETFQDAGCALNGTSEQINFQTPLLDLSTIYGVDDKALETVRLHKHGLLKLERRGERSVPRDISDRNVTTEDKSNVPTEVKSNVITEDKSNVTTEDKSSVASEDKSNVTTEYNTSIIALEAKISENTPINNISSKDICIQNIGNETMCYQFGFPEVGNFDLRTTTLTIFFMREHNRLARILRQMHPCWKDDRLFKVARQINIATASNIFMYELLPALLGYDNMVNYGLISDRVQHVTAYDEDEVPLVYAEYDIATRFFHTFLDGRIKRYDENYRYVGEFSFSETLYKQGLIEKDKNFEEINRGTFFQNAAKIDDIQDPEISEKFYGSLQRAHDLAAMDIQRGRDLAIRGYNDYREICGLKQAKNFEDFLDVMDIEKVVTLKDLYSDVDDVDLLAGLISETMIKGTFVGTTLFCIMAKQLQVFRFTDRFWFERGDQLHSLTLAQLQEIRRTNMARLACDNAEAVQSIQPRAFLNVGHGNMHVPCTHIPGPDLTKWQDSSCQKWDQEASKGSKQKNDQEKKSQYNKEPQNMIMDYTNFFNSLLSYNKQQQV